MVTVPVKVTFNFDEEDPAERKKKKTSSDESSTSDEDSTEERMPDLEGHDRKRTPGFSDEPQVSRHLFSCIAWPINQQHSQSGPIIGQSVIDDNL